MSQITRRAALIGMAAAAGGGLGAAWFGAARGADPRSAALETPNASDATHTGRLRFACGESGGLYLEFGELLRDALAARGGPELELIVTRGSADNLALLDSGAADLAITLADTARDSATSSASDAAMSAASPATAGLVAIGKVYQNYLQCVVRADGPITELANLGGHPLSIGATGSGTAFTVRRLLAAAGLTTAQVPPLPREARLQEALRDLADGAIDALFWSGGIPTPKVSQLSRNHSLALVNLASVVPPLQAAHPGLYRVASVPAGVYGIPEPTSTLGISNYLVARPDLAPSAARALVDCLIRDARDLIPAKSVGLQFLTPASLIDTGVLPLHPAAQRRYGELYG